MSKILGVNVRCYADQYNQFGKEQREIVTNAVLVGGEIGDYACYVGNGDPEWVARFGDKISFEEACCHFPSQLKKDLYRE